jgi:hypothetical protein
MTDAERRLLLMVANRLADLLEADAESIDKMSAEADEIRELIASIEQGGSSEGGTTPPEAKAP